MHKFVMKATLTLKPSAEGQIIVTPDPMGFDEVGEATDALTQWEEDGFGLGIDQSRVQKLEVVIEATE